MRSGNCYRVVLLVLHLEEVGWETSLIPAAPIVARF